MPDGGTIGPELSIPALPPIGFGHYQGAALQRWRLEMNQIPQSTEFDQAAAEAFQGRLVDMLNGSAVALMLSIGHRTGLFDAMAKLPPATSGEIAGAAGLAERYVREWLAVMVTGGIVSYDPERRSYLLPPAHAASLTRGAPLGNLAIYAQFAAMGGAVEPRLVQAFRTGEGVPYDAYPCFHQVMSEDSAQTVVAGIEDTIAALAPDLIGRLDAGIDVLDAGCGVGRAAIALARRFPKSRFTGWDLCPDAIDLAVQAADGVDNAAFAVRDLTHLDEDGAFDLVTSFDAVHDQKDPARLLAAIRRALRPGGVHLMQDIGGSARLENNLDFPFAPFLYAVSTAHCTPVSLAQGGAGLGTMWGWETAEAMLGQAGFAETRRHALPHDPMNVWFVSRTA
jgi:SAM-dependent methyltransferase